MAKSKWKVAELVTFSGYSDFSTIVILLAVLGHNKMLKYRAMCVKDGLRVFVGVQYQRTISTFCSKQIFLVALATDSYKPKKFDY